jgi:hypothetical protein
MPAKINAVTTVIRQTIPKNSRHRNPKNREISPPLRRGAAVRRGLRGGFGGGVLAARRVGAARHSAYLPPRAAALCPFPPCLPIPVFLVLLPATITASARFAKGSGR